MKTVLGIPYYTVAEAATELAVSERTMRLYLYTGQVQGSKRGGKWLVTREQLEAFVKGGSRGN